MLANVVRKPMRQIFSEFGGVMPSGADYGTGDVKYHLGHLLRPAHHLGQARPPVPAGQPLPPGGEPPPLLPARLLLHPL